MLHKLDSIDCYFDSKTKNILPIISGEVKENLSFSIIDPIVIFSDIFNSITESEMEIIEKELNEKELHMFKKLQKEKDR
jgi:hypothetical protein